ncbi:MAG: 4Fe-4S binding protein [Anaerolineae bacterium]|nr:4Fe-4S binding protein [Anaerolineae bacterium]
MHQGVPARPGRDGLRFRPDPGDLAAAADKSFDCIMCGLCVSRCPTDLAPPNAALLARRLYARDIAPRAQHLAEAIAALQAGRWDAEVAALKAMPEDALKQRYAARTIEP